MDREFIGRAKEVVQKVKNDRYVTVHFQERKVKHILSNREVKDN